MIKTVLKTTYKKPEPKVIHYRDYKNFDKEAFKTDLRSLRHSPRDSYNSFESSYLKILEKHAPIRRKTLRGNQVPYMTKQLRKAIMKRTELCSKYSKCNTLETLHAFKKQRNYCSRLYKKERRKTDRCPPVHGNGLHKNVKITAPDKLKNYSEKRYG